jgi:hypothetical protein
MNIDKEQFSMPVVGQKILDFRLPIFFCCLLAIYGTVIWQARSLARAEPGAAAIASQSATAPTNPHIDQATVDKIKQLQDNSVDVRALFDQARQSPFQE